MNPSDEVVLAKIVSSLEAGIQSACESALNVGWRLRKMQRVQRHRRTPSAIRIEHPEVLLLDFKIVGFFSDLVLESTFEEIESCISENEIFLVKLEVGNFGADFDKAWRVRAATNNFVKDFCREYLSGLDNIGWHVEWFKQTCEALRSFLEAERQEVIVRSPLINFSMNEESLSSENVRIEPPQMEYVERLFDSELAVPEAGDPFQWVGGLRIAALTTTVRIGDSSFAIQDQLIEALGHVVTALRLMADGVAGLGDVWIDRIGPRFGCHFEGLIQNEHGHSVGPALSLVVNSNTASELATITQAIIGDRDDKADARALSIAIVVSQTK